MNKVKICNFVNFRKDKERKTLKTKFFCRS